jgi:elongation factor Ts
VLNAEQVVGYTHAGNKIGVLLSLSKSTSEEGVALARDIAMQIAAMRPIAVDRDGIDEATIERERTIAKEQILAEGKPANMVDKIAEGKLNKFFKENTLVNQAFVKDNSKSVKQVLTDLDKDLHVVSFKRVELGA